MVVLGLKYLILKIPICFQSCSRNAQVTPEVPEEIKNNWKLISFQNYKPSISNSYLIRQCFDFSLPSFYGASLQITLPFLFYTKTTIKTTLTFQIINSSKFFIQNTMQIYLTYTMSHKHEIWDMLDGLKIVFESLKSF